MKTKSILLIIMLVIFLFNCNAQEPKINEALPVTEYDPINTVSKNKIITYLNNFNGTKKVIIGQNIGHADYSANYKYSYMQDIEKLTSKKPGLLGVDLGWFDMSTDFTSLISDLQTFYNQHGLITISMHPANPKTYGSVRDKNFNSKDFNDIISDGTKIRKAWKDSILNNVANLFQRLKEKNIIVLWRPLHEMNGGWFWWGNDQNWPSQEQFIAIWKDMYDYFYTSRKLDNLIWVYSPNYKYDPSLKDANYYYPGSDYVDVVGLDYYNDIMTQLNDNSSYDQLLALNKPMSICEIGPKELRDGSFDNQKYLDIKNIYSKVAYFLVWHSWDSNPKAIQDNQNAIAVMNHSDIITLDEVSY